MRLHLMTPSEAFSFACSSRDCRTKWLYCCYLIEAESDVGHCSRWSDAYSQVCPAGETEGEEVVRVKIEKKVRRGHE